MGVPFGRRGLSSAGGTRKFSHCVALQKLTAKPSTDDGSLLAPGVLRRLVDRTGTRAFPAFIFPGGFLDKRKPRKSLIYGAEYSQSVPYNNTLTEGLAVDPTLLFDPADRTAVSGLRYVPVSAWASLFFGDQRIVRVTIDASRHPSLDINHRVLLFVALRGAREKLLT
jgi:hypothetical protein